MWTCDIFESVTRKGVVGEVEGERIALGNRALLEDLEIDPGGLEGQAEVLSAEGQTVMYLTGEGSGARNNRCSGSDQGDDS